MIKDQCIMRPGDQGDGVSFWDGASHVVEDSVIDLSACDLDEIDEALGVTYGSSVVVKNCVIRGAGKLVLCGCGDADKVAVETGKIVVFKDCILENFGRRGPEVQDGMQVTLHNCLIRNWGDPDRFNVRSFGAWAHGENSIIMAANCVFWQDNGRFGRYWFKDLIGHIGQAFNDTKFRGLFSRDAWRPGNCRALVASDGGYVRADNCWANHSWLAIENHHDAMGEAQAMSIVGTLENMKHRLYAKFGLPDETY